jgi:homoserine dehydrogenase
LNAAAASLVAPGARGSTPARVALLGTGTVGSAVISRLAGWIGAPLGARLSLVYAANTRAAASGEDGLCPRSLPRLMLPSSGAANAGHHDSSASASRSHAVACEERPVGRRGNSCTSGDIRAAPASASALGAPFGDACSLADDATSHLGPRLRDVAVALGDVGPRIVIDATASDAVAAHHAVWLAQGIDVVTACKLGAGTSLARWQLIRAACDKTGSRYGDSATVGAGLPLLRAIRELQEGGDCIRAIAGVLSGSLAWLFDEYDGMRPFSALVRRARAAGYTEPDPRDDLSGEDVRRKLLILARAAGVALDAEAVSVASLVPPALSRLGADQVDGALALIDRPLRARFAQARRQGDVLRFVARLEDGDARVGLEALPPTHPVAGGAGTDNRVAIWSDRYREQPLVIQGPGAGAAVTAAALLDDALRFAGSRAATRDPG